MQLVGSISSAMVTASDQLHKSFLTNTTLLKELQRTGLRITDRIGRNTEIREQLYKLSSANPNIETVVLITPDRDVVYYSRTYNTMDTAKLLQQTWLEDLMAPPQPLNFSPAHDQSCFIRTQALYPLQMKILQLLNPSVEVTQISAIGSKTYNEKTIRAAVVIFALLPLLAVYPFVQKYFVKGAMLGSVKG